MGQDMGQLAPSCIEECTQLVDRVALHGRGDVAVDIQRGANV